MKLTIALLIFICMASVTIHLAAIKKIDAMMAAVLLSFAIGAAFVAANYDIIYKAKVSKDGLEIETAISTINKVKDSSLQEIKEEVESQKQSVRLLIENANDTGAKLKKQENSILKVVDSAQKLKTDLEKIQEKEERKIFRPFSDDISQRIKQSLSSFRDAYADKKVKIRLLGVSPSIQYSKKISEIITLFNQYVSCSYSNTVLTAESPVIIVFNPDSEQFADSFLHVLSIMYPRGGIDSDRRQSQRKEELTIYLLGSPRFLDDGTMYFE